MQWMNTQAASNHYSWQLRIILLVAIALLCPSMALAQGTDCSALQVDNAWVRAAPSGVTVMAGYFEVTNSGDSAIPLTAISSPEFERAEMHESTTNDKGAATMKPAGTVALAPGDTVAFAPGGYHVMLFSPQQAIEPGDEVALVLHCGSNATRSIAAEVRTITPMSSGAHSEHHTDHVTH